MQITYKEKEAMQNKQNYLFACFPKQEKQTRIQKFVTENSITLQEKTNLKVVLVEMTEQDGDTKRPCAYFECFVGGQEREVVDTDEEDNIQLFNGAMNCDYIANWVQQKRTREINKYKPIMEIIEIEQDFKF